MGDPKNQPDAGSGAPPVPARPTICADDFAVNESMALLFSEEAPLPVSTKIKKARGNPTKDDYKAVWAWVPQKPDQALLIFFHGNNHYVTVGRLKPPPQKGGQEEQKQEGKKTETGPAPPKPSRMPDWAEGDESARRGVLATQAAGIYYGLDELEGSQKKILPDKGQIKRPVILVPEDVELYQGGFWAVPPKGQYTDAAKLGKLVENSYQHLRCLSDSTGEISLASTKDKSGPAYVENLNRIYLCGHSGGGKPMLESAAAELALSKKVPVDLWLFDATYGWGTWSYVEFCKQWLKAGRLGNGASQSRFVCIFKSKYEELEWEDKKKTIPKIDPKTKKQAWHWVGTEMEADRLREEIAAVLHKEKQLESLWIEHKYDRKKGTDNMSTVIIPALMKSEVLFVRTYLEHEDIPTQFIPVLLATAAT